ncbi:hypothetical protein JVU11DRAFT_9687 [Chiua virens]|nr:hypothetical protein JVU11DRAFT_9687 [Chiua virens]
MLLILAVYQTVKQSFVLYKETRHWQPNRYISQLARDGIVYFIMYAPIFSPQSVVIFPF